MSLTVILPCAGEGRRLGLGSPKELFEIIPGRRLIDFSLDHIRAAAGRIPLRVAVVVRAGKQAVARYVRQRLRGIRVSTATFDENLQEWPGSVHSARWCYGTYNAVLLPDSCPRLGRKDAARDEKGRTLLERVAAALRRQPVAFGAVSCRDPERLKRLGAVWIDRRGRVTAFQDKPRGTFGKFNAFWGCYGFRKEFGKTLYQFLIASVKHRPSELKAQLFHPAAAFRLHSYQDLGTWPAIRGFRAQFGI